MSCIYFHFHIARGSEQAAVKQQGLTMAWKKYLWLLTVIALLTVSAVRAQDNGKYFYLCIFTIKVISLRCMTVRISSLGFGHRRNAAIRWHFLPLSFFRLRLIYFYWCSPNHTIEEISELFSFHGLFFVLFDFANKCTSNVRSPLYPC